MLATALEPVFHPGTFPPRNRRRRQQRERNQRPVKKLPSKAPAIQTGCCKGCKEINFKGGWFILPDVERDPDVYGTTLILGHTMTHAYNVLERFRVAKPLFFNPRSEAFSKAIFGQAYSSKELAKQFARDLESQLRYNARIRWTLKRFLCRYLARKLQIAAVVDPVTLDEPVKPVLLYDWKQRRVYTFEARSIFIDIQRRILTHDQLFINPQLPRNPYTNERLRTWQMMHVFDQLRAYGLTHWTIESLRSLRYDWPSFTHTNGVPLRLEALQGTFHEPNTEDCNDLVLDFIETEHFNTNKVYYQTLYEWALEFRPEHPKVVCWRALCRTYYKFVIMYDSHPQREAMLTAAVYSKTKALCEKPDDLLLERSRQQRRLLTVRRQQQRSGPSSSPAPPVQEHP
jgi:hypothetical protein